MDKKVVMPEVLDLVRSDDGLTVDEVQGCFAINHAFDLADVELFSDLIALAMRDYYGEACFPAVMEQLVEMMRTRTAVRVVLCGRHVLYFPGFAAVK